MKAILSRKLRIRLAQKPNKNVFVLGLTVTYIQLQSLSTRLSLTKTFTFFSVNIKLRLQNAKTITDFCNLQFHAEKILVIGSRIKAVFWRDISSVNNFLELMLLWQSFFMGLATNEKEYPAIWAFKSPIIRKVSPTCYKWIRDSHQLVQKLVGCSLPSYFACKIHCNQIKERFQPEKLVYC